MAYSQDLRDRVIDAGLVEGMSRRGAAVRLGVSETAAINWVKRVEQTGSRAPAQLGGYKPMMWRRIGSFSKPSAVTSPTLRFRAFAIGSWRNAG